MKIGSFIKQPAGYKAFIPAKFPPKEGFSFGDAIFSKASHATLLLGNLNGVSSSLPDMNFFIKMYFRKDAASSSQIEGTRATMTDSILSESGLVTGIPDDVDDIIHYVKALDYAFKRMESFPLCIPLIKDLHRELLYNARSTHYSDPGNFRKTQNWIGGTTPGNADFVPPPPFEMLNGMYDLEKFIRSKNAVIPLLKTGIAHAQFETIHPFLDGNGRVGRILVTLMLNDYGLLEKPVLFLSSYFRKHRQIYYSRLTDYHNGFIDKWLGFFLDGIIETAGNSVNLIRKLNKLIEYDSDKLKSLSRNAAESAKLIVQNLYSMPVTNVSGIMKWTGFSRPGAEKIIDKLVKLGILTLKDKNVKYGKTYVYKAYLEIFE